MKFAIITSLFLGSYSLQISADTTHFKDKIASLFTKKIPKADDESEESKTYLNMGYDFYYGKNGKSQSFKEADHYFELACNSGSTNSDMFFKRGHIHHHGLIALRPDFEKAHHFYQLAGLQNHAQSLNLIGDMYMHGLIGNDIDYHKARHYYKAAADLGSDAAQYNLAYMFKNGLGGEKDLEQALFYFKLAAEQGHLHSLYELGLFDLGKTSFSLGETSCAVFPQTPFLA